MRARTVPLQFSPRSEKTDKIWYYDLLHVRVGKKTPLTLAQCLQAAEASAGDNWLYYIFGLLRKYTSVWANVHRWNQIIQLQPVQYHRGQDTDIASEKQAVQDTPERIVSYAYRRISRADVG